MRCDKCGEEIEEAEEHLFAGWGFFVGYHKECCPRIVDGWECDLHDEEEEN